MPSTIDSCTYQLVPMPHHPRDFRASSSKDCGGDVTHTSHPKTYEITCLLNYLPPEQVCHVSLAKSCHVSPIFRPLGHPKMQNIHASRHMPIGVTCLVDIMLTSSCHHGYNVTMLANKNVAIFLHLLVHMLSWVWK